MASLNWELANRRQLVSERGGTPATERESKPEGITNEQAKVLGKLRRQQGIPYDGNGMTRARANAAIKAAKMAAS